jgi:hypothetical protein
MGELRLTIEMNATALGQRSACRFADYFGDKRVRIPKAPYGPSGLTSAVGAHSARLLCERFGGGAIDVPTSSPYRRTQIARLRREGMSPAAIARRVARTQRYVCDGDGRTKLLCDTPKVSEIRNADNTTCRACRPRSADEPFHTALRGAFPCNSSKRLVIFCAHPR